jgi:hypothetical protein
VGQSETRDEWAEREAVTIEEGRFKVHHLSRGGLATVRRDPIYQIYQGYLQYSLQLSTHT